MRLDDLNLRAFGQAIDTVGDHAIAGGKPGANDHLQAILNTRRDRMLADLVIGVQHPYEVALVAHLQGGGRDHHCILFGIHQHAGVNELVGEQRIVLVAEAGLQLDGAGGGVNLVIQAEQRAAGDFLLVGAVPGLNLQGFTRLLRLNHRRDVIFRQRED